MRRPQYPARIRQEKIQILADQSGLDSMSLLEQYQLESLVPCICMNEKCDYWTELEPDQTRGWCEECQTRSLMSLFVLAGII